MASQFLGQQIFSGTTTHSISPCELHPIKDQPKVIRNKLLAEYACPERGVCMQLLIVELSAGLPGKTKLLQLMPSTRIIMCVEALYGASECSQAGVASPVSNSQAIAITTP